MKKKRSLASCIQEFWPAAILTPIFVIGEVAFDVLIPLMTGKLLDEGVKAGSMHHIAGRSRSSPLPTLTSSPPAASSPA